MKGIQDLAESPTNPYLGPKTSETQPTDEQRLILWSRAGDPSTLRAVRTGGVVRSEGHEASVLGKLSSLRRIFLKRLTTGRARRKQRARCRCGPSGQIFNIDTNERCRCLRSLYRSLSRPFARFAAGRAGFDPLFASCTRSAGGHYHRPIPAREKDSRLSERRSQFVPGRLLRRLTRLHLRSV